MFWPVLLTGFILIFGGGTAFWLALTCKPKPALFVTLELIAITLLPARFVLGPICGGWLALAFFVERRERMAAPVFDGCPDLDGLYQPRLPISASTRSRISPDCTKAFMTL